MEIQFKNVSYTYQPNSPFEHQAVKNVSLSIPTRSFAAIIGHTGSGKSTLLQHINGLLRPTEGTLKVGDFELSAKKHPDIKALRKQVGVVFQYPEHQLFEETVEKDILFGPTNFGLDLEEARQRLPDVLKTVGLSEDVLERSPFELSGGQMRRVAIAGVLMTQPKVLILDEPAAGLDPQGRRQMIQLFKDLNEKEGLTVVLVTHHMDDALDHADFVYILNQGQLAMEGVPEEVFTEKEKLQSIGLDVPEKIQLISKLNDEFGLDLPFDLKSPEEIGRLLAKKFKTGDRS